MARKVTEHYYVTVKLTRCNEIPSSHFWDIAFIRVGQMWSSSEVTVTLTFDHQNLISPSKWKFVLQFKKFPQGFHEICDTDGCTTRKHNEAWKHSGHGRVNPDIEFAALHIVMLNINSSFRPSYLKDRTMWAILPIRQLWFNLELHSHSCSSITEC